MPAFERYASSTMIATASGPSDDVVVAEEQEGRALDGRQRVVRGGREADVRRRGGARTRAASSPRCAGVGSSAEPLSSTSTDSAGYSWAARLATRILEPGARVARDDDRDDGRRGVRRDDVVEILLVRRRRRFPHRRRPPRPLREASRPLVGGGRRPGPGLGSGVSMGRARIAAGTLVRRVTSACNC